MEAISKTGTILINFGRIVLGIMKDFYLILRSSSVTLKPPISRSDTRHFR